jgi:septal ring factor EnvC (AmiA/AmiB activator)
METLKKYWAAIAGAVIGFIGLLMWLLSNKKDEINSLNAQVSLAKTDKEADVLEAQIKEMKDNKDNLQKHNDELDKSLQAVQQKRNEIIADQKDVTDPKEIAAYWNKQ